MRGIAVSVRVRVRRRRFGDEGAVQGAAHLVEALRRGRDMREESLLRAANAESCCAGIADQSDTGVVPSLRSTSRPTCIDVKGNVRSTWSTVTNPVRSSTTRCEANPRKPRPCRLPPGARVRELLSVRAATAVAREQLAHDVQRPLVIGLREAGAGFPHVLAARDRDVRRPELQAEAVGDQVEQVGGGRRTLIQAVPELAVRQREPRDRPDRRRRRRARTMRCRSARRCSCRPAAAAPSPVEAITVQSLV